MPFDLILLPVMFNTAFCVDDPSLAEDADGETLQWMQSLAKQKNAAVCGSLLYKEKGSVYNRFIFVAPEGILGRYSKHHLFSLVDENKYLSKGNEKTIIPYKGWKIQPFICYDLRFPTWCDNSSEADLQLFVANWPQKRIHHWSILLQARAIENQCYVAGVNRVGNDIHGNEHNGRSSVFDATGAALCRMDGIGVEVVTLRRETLDAHRKKYPFRKDRD
jgi:predicted amidohydrolase